MRIAARARIGVALGLAMACGAPPPRFDPRAPPPIDDAVELAALLPDGIDRCVVTRPRRLAERRRALVVYHSWAEPWVWDRALPIRAYASAVAERADGRRARRTYVRFIRDVDPGSLDRLPVRWIDDDCEDLECRLPVARFLDPRTLEITRHAWPRRGTRESSARCVSGARNHAEAFEIAVDASGSHGPSGFAPPMFTERVLRASGSGLSFLTVSAFRDPVEADLVEAWMRDRGSVVESSLIPLPPNDRRVSRQGNRISVLDTRLFEELELALEDEQLRRRALVLSQRRTQPLPLEEVDVSRIAVVRHQVEQRRAALRRVQGTDRADEAEALATLLERAVAAHPDDAEVFTQLVRVCLDELFDAPRALRYVERARALHADQLGPAVDLAQLRREALSHTDVAALGRALREDSIVDADDAALAAEDVRALREAGVSYDWAEGAFLLSRALFEGAPPRTAMRVRLDVEGLVAALLAEARVALDRDDLTVQVALHTSDPGEVAVIGDASPELLIVHAPLRAGRILVAAAPSGEMTRWRRVGARLHDNLSEGPIDLVIDLSDANGQRVRRSRVRGRLVGHEIEILAVDESLAGADFAVLSRYVARPLAELPIALFPPPELLVVAETEENLAAVTSAIHARPSFVASACVARGTSLRCRSPRPGTDLDDLVVSLLRARLELGR